MKTAVISTYCEWNSFGSVLQSIGLQDTLESIGVNHTVIRVEEPKKAAPVKYGSWKHPKSFLLNLYKFSHRRKTLDAYQKNKKFIGEHVKVRTYSSDEALAQNCPDADVYIAGSDQIWHPGLQRKDFFLQYAPEAKPRISYAASMGLSSLPEEKKPVFAEYLRRFQSVSVRESDMVPLIKPLTDKDVQVHIDPTFLKDADEWRVLEHPYKVKGPYILVYPIYWDMKLNAQLIQLRKSTGLNLVAVCPGVRTVYANQVIRDADPGEFLWLIDHAECVVTSSFHGVAFSVIFNKNFSAVVNPASPSRIQSLLSILNIKTPEVKGCLKDFTVDYRMVNQTIQRERERSLAYLRREIFGEE